jgi:hypothetical protein
VSVDPNAGWRYESEVEGATKLVVKFEHEGGEVKIEVRLTASGAVARIEAGGDG